MTTLCMQMYDQQEIYKGTWVRLLACARPPRMCMQPYTQATNMVTLSRPMFTLFSLPIMDQLDLGSTYRDARGVRCGVRVDALSLSSLRFARAPGGGGLARHLSVLATKCSALP